MNPSGKREYSRSKCPSPMKALTRLGESTQVGLVRSIPPKTSLNTLCLNQRLVYPVSEAYGVQELEFVFSQLNSL